MEIYAEYLFVENFAASFLILLLTGKICGRNIRRPRLIFGSIVCGIYAFILLSPIGTIAALFSKLAFSMLLIIYTFAIFPAKKSDIISRTRGGLKILITFYITSFIMGGVTVACMYAGGIKGVASNGSVYIESPTYFNIITGVGLTWLLGIPFAKFIKERTRVEKMFRDAVVEIEGQRWPLKAMIDTGNFLKEPSTGKPVAIICKSAAEEILMSGKAGKERFSVIPYKSIGSEGGVLIGFRVDKIIMGARTIENMVLAVYEGEFNQAKEGETYRLLMNRELLEGGIAVHV